MRCVPRHHRPALIVTLVAVIAAVGLRGPDGLTARGEPPQLTFRGHLVCDPRASVLLRQGSGHGNRRRGRFEAENVPLLCDDGSTPRVQRRTGFVRFAANGTFANLFSHGLSQGYESFFRLDGRVRSRRRAEGTIFIYQDPRDPPSSPEAAECSTPEPLRWKASRKHR
jgi:hypothetical protein